MNDERRKRFRRAPWDPGGITIDLDSDRSIWCYDYHVSSTYLGLLEGNPIPSINNRRLEQAPEDARRLFGDGKTHILNSELRQTTLAVDPEWEDEVVRYFPPVRIIGRFKSTAMDPDEHFSTLILVWWQDSFHTVPDEGALARLKALDWPHLAADYSL